MFSTAKKYDLCTEDNTPDFSQKSQIFLWKENQWSDELMLKLHTKILSYLLQKELQLLVYGGMTTLVEYEIITVATPETWNPLGIHGILF